MGIRITTGNLDHLEQCHQLLTDSELGKVYFLQKNPYRMLSRALADQEIFVAKSGEEQCIGFLWVEVNGTFGKYPYLHMLVVDRKFQGQGIGKQLMVYLEEVISTGYSKIFLLVGDFNRGAREFYSKLGYQSIGLLPDFYIPGVNEYLLMKEK